MRTTGALAIPSPHPLYRALVVKRDLSLWQAGQPLFAVERSVANDGGAGSPVKAGSRGGGGRRPAFTGLTVPPDSATEVDGSTLQIYLQLLLHRSAPRVEASLPSSGDHRATTLYSVDRRGSASRT
jgi:hypothetical protein